MSPGRETGAPGRGRPGARRRRSGGRRRRCVAQLAAVEEELDPDDVLLSVGVGDDGDATWRVEYRVRLDDDDGEAAFEAYREDLEANTSDYLERFHNRMNATAGDAGEATGRGMAIRNDSVDARRENLPQQYGVVVYTFEWTNFGAVDGDRLTGTEPFASGFEPDRTFTVAAPDGYAVTSATPEPSSSGATTASWSAGTSLEGFELVAAPSAGSGDGATDGVGAGFGAGVAATALVGAALLARRRP